MAVVRDILLETDQSDLREQAENLDDTYITRLLFRFLPIQKNPIFGGLYLIKFCVLMEN